MILYHEQRPSFLEGGVSEERAREGKRRVGHAEGGVRRRTEFGFVVVVAQFLELIKEAVEYNVNNRTGEKKMR